MTASGEPSPDGKRVTDDIEANLKAFLRNGSLAKSHPAKLIVITDLLRDVFELTLEELLPGIETKVGSKILGVRGSVDLLFQGVIIELKTRFDDEREKAKTELVKYFQSLLEKYGHAKYVGLVTDLVQFELFRPSIEKGSVIDVIPIDKFNSIEKSTKETLFWLDAVFFSGLVETPTADELCMKFGPGSATHSIATSELGSLWDQVKDLESSKTKIRIWRKAMEIVYGTAPEDSAFIDQTYLSMLVRLLVFLRLGGKPSIDKDEMLAALSGQYFVEHGLMNLIEEDFFSWILNKQIQNRATLISSNLGNALRTYDITLANEDLFKELYQKIVSMHQRHGTGEYYTPRWLCEYILQRALEAYAGRSKGRPRVLDPACGSGSFLTAAIHSLKKDISDTEPKKQLAQILASVMGLDINPLAVTIARANYAIALGDLIQIGEPITIPVYVADSIKLPRLLPTVYGGCSSYDLVADGRHLPVPASVFQDPVRRNAVLGILREIVVQYGEGLKKKDCDALFQRLAKGHLNDDENSILSFTLRELLKLIDKGKNSIWLFVLSNLYAPLMLKESHFDILIGNPPWIVLRSIANPEYQNFLKEEINNYGLSDKSETSLFTHMEMATLFFCATSDLYLRNNGLIAFVMPISVITGASQHTKFNEFKIPPMELDSVHSFKHVSEIFSLPPCVIIAEKGKDSKFPVKKIELSGSLRGNPRNSPLTTVLPLLCITKSEYKPVEAMRSMSHYFSKFHEGATLVPRNLFFVEPGSSKDLGVDARQPLLATSRDVDRVAKKPWKGMSIKDRVESEFLFYTLLGKDLVPFGQLQYRPVILPLENQGKYKLLDVAVLRASGYSLMAAWLEKAQALWEKNRTSKSATNFPRIIDRLDHNGFLTNQDPSKRFVVIYNCRGADAMASVIDRTALSDWHIGTVRIAPKGFVADTTTYVYELDNETEAHYISAVLNAPSINKAVKPIQPDGLYGKRDIYRRPFMLKVPRFDASIAEHISLSSISQYCHSIVPSTYSQGVGFRTSRRKVFYSLVDELNKIDAIVSSLGMTELSDAAYDELDSLRSYDRDDESEE